MRNPGLYKEVNWRIPIKFVDGYGLPLDVSGRIWVARMWDTDGVQAYVFRSIGATNNEGTINVIDASSGIISLNATVARHVAVPNGRDYTWTLYDEGDPTNPYFMANGDAYVGVPGESKTKFRVLNTYDDNEAQLISPGVPFMPGMYFPRRSTVGDCAAILNALPADLHGLIYLHPGDWSFKTKLWLRSHVIFLQMPGCRIINDMPVDGILIESPPDKVLVHGGFLSGGGYIDMGAHPGSIIHIHSQQFNQWDFKFDGSDATVIGLELRADSTTTMDSVTGTLNSVSNTFDRVIHFGSAVGKLVRIQGQGDGAGGLIGAFTLNTFNYLRSSFTHQIFMEFDQWCDTNQVKWAYGRLSAPGARLVHFGETDVPGTVYAEDFLFLCAGPYGSFGGRSGIYAGNLTKNNKIHTFFVDGDLSGEGGNVVDGGAQSYDIGSLAMSNVSGGSIMREISKNRIYSAMSLELVRPVSIPTDTAISFDFGLLMNRGNLFINSSDGDIVCWVWCNLGAVQGSNPPMIIKGGDATFITVGFGVATGTTGPTSRVNFRQDGSKFYIENRLPNTYKFGVTSLSPISSVI